jgi:hypothetical protein
MAITESGITVEPVPDEGVDNRRRPHGGLDPKPIAAVLSGLILQKSADRRMREPRRGRLA